MARFTVRQLLLATTIIAVGLGLIVVASTFENPSRSEWLTALQIGLAGAGSYTIGAGVAYPFGRSRSLEIAIGSVILWPALFAVFWQ